MTCDKDTMLGWASQHEYLHLPWVISLLQAVHDLRCGRRAGRGSGTRSSTETKASASRRGWHGREVTARNPHTPPPSPTTAPAFAQERVIHHPSGFRCLVTCPWRTRIQHRTKVSAYNERFDSWRVTEAEVMELLQI